jgi:hypothetical protein
MLDPGDEMCYASCQVVVTRVFPLHHEQQPRRADTNGTPYCGRATGGPNRRPRPNQPGTPAPGGRGTDAPRPPPVRTRFNGTTAPDVGFRARRGSGGAGGRGLGQRPERPEAATEGAGGTARPSDVLPGTQVYSKRAQLFCSELATILLVGNIGKQGSSSSDVGASPAIDQSGEDSPRAGRRATWWPPSAQPRAARSPSAISPRGRSTTASSGRLGPVLHLAVEITQVRR